MGKIELPEARGVQILLVDDEEGFASVLEKRLARRGFSVEYAPSGSEAILKLRARLFDLVVLDLKMQDMDGLEVLRIFRKMDPNLPVIILTGHGSDELAALERDRDPMSDYLIKPCDFDELLARILELVREARTRA